MSQSLPKGGFKLIDIEESHYNKYSDDSKKGSILQVEFE